MRVFALLFALFGLIGGSAVAWVYADRVITRLETRNVTRLASALRASEISWPSLRADGQLLIVSGPAPDDAAAALVLQMAADVLPAALVSDATQRSEGQTATGRAERIQPPRLEILRSDAGISLMGRAPSGPALSALRAALTALPNGGGVANLVDVTDDPVTPDWNAAVEFALRALSQTPEATLTIMPGHVTIETVASTSGWQEGLAELLEHMRPPDVALELNILAPRPVISPFRFAFDLTGESPVFECAARNEDEAAGIIAAAEAAGLPAGLGECAIGIGAPSELWGMVVGRSLATLSALGSGKLEIIDTDIIFTDVSAPLAVLGSTEISLRAELPAIYSVRPLGQVAQAAPAPVATPGQNGWGPRFLAIRDADGYVVLRGMVRDTLTSKVISSYAESRFGYEHVQNDFVETSDLPDGWQARIFTALDALTLLDTGQATITANAFVLRGTGALPDLEAELHTMLEISLGAGNFNLQVVQTEPLVVDEPLMDARLCAARVATILAENQISFAPSSAVIEDSSAGVITDLGLLLHECRHVDFQIGGHTDSQGREEMNAALSQSRANAVVDALLSQNLLMGQLSAFGYGESQPIASNDTEEGRAANRRIEILPLDEAQALQAAATEEEDSTAEEVEDTNE
ncbi:MAG: OmpA family protein [Paracoccaceae bacterium]